MIAGLPMYLQPSNAAAHEAFWRGVRDALREAGLAAPDALQNETPLGELWGDAGLVLSHICNLPYRLHFRDRVTRIAASDYPLDGCAPGYYRSLFVVREDHPAQAPEDLDGSTMAYNDAESHSGWGAPWTWAQDRGLRFDPVLPTGAHKESLRAVANGTVAFAAIDAWTFEVLKPLMPEIRAVRVIGATDPAPGMTFITRGGVDPAPYRAALEDAFTALEPHHRESLGLRGFPVLPDEAYDLPFPPHPDAWRS